MEHQAIEALRNDIIGSYEKFTGPFGEKPISYTDWTASGRSLASVNQYIEENVCPLYGNTHTTTSITGYQSTCYRHEARQIVAEAVKAKITGRASEDAVLFVGNGTTAAVNKLVQMLGLHHPLPMDIGQEYRPIVFVSSYEHHSNLLPWRESVADVVVIPYCPTDGVSLSDLRNELENYRDRKVKIGAFSAASNVTGILTNVNGASILMHRAGGLAVFDYATAAPYVQMDMNPVVLGDDSSFVYKDAIYFSGHKFVGGPGAPGVLVAKRRIMRSRDQAPAEPGGGTVFYVTDENHRYQGNVEEREEGGTPDIIADIRLGLVMHVKQSIGVSWIESEEMRISKLVSSRLESMANLVLLGRGAGIPETARHLPLFSFLIRHGARFLHHNFVSALLNDLFGIQSRGGCVCAGPFAQLILGMTKDVNEAMELLLLDKHEVYRPGFTRLSFPFWLTELEIDFILSAIDFVVNHGWKFLPLYRYNHKTGVWAHTTRLTHFPERKWLSRFQIPGHSDRTREGSESVSHANIEDYVKRTWGVESEAALLQRVSSDAQSELATVEKLWKKRAIKSSGGATVGDGSADPLTALRWFVLEEDCISDQRSQIVELVGPIRPVCIYSNTNPQSPHASDGAVNVTANAFVAKQSAKFRERKGISTADDTPIYVQLGKRLASANSERGGESDITYSGAMMHMSMLKTDTSRERLDEVEVDSTPKPKIARIVPENDDAKPAEATCVAAGDLIGSSVCSSGSCATQGLSYAHSRIVEKYGGVIDVVREGEDTALVEFGIKTIGVTFPCVQKVIPVRRNLLNPSSHSKPIVDSVDHDPAVDSAANAAYTQCLKRHVQPPKKILKHVGQAIIEWGMIQEGDRLLLGLSGGKDSLALLHILLAIQKKAPVRFEIGCATVDPQTTSFDPSPLIPYVQSLGVTYHYLSHPIVEMAKSKLQGDSLCAFCSRFKRGLLYSCCRTHKYNKLVLAQHLDDLAESFIMSALHNGQVRTMKANYKIEAGDVRVIRPLIYVRETATRDFSQGSRFPVINENCPACFEEPKERARVKRLLTQEESMVPALFCNLKRALIPLLHDDTYHTMTAVTIAVENAGRNPRNRPPQPTATKRKHNQVSQLLGQSELSTSEHLDVNVTEDANEDDDRPTTEPVCSPDGFCAPCFELV